MSISLFALDYSRPMRALFEQAQRAGTIHSVFRRATNIALDETLVTILSSELPRMPNGLRLPSLTANELLSSLQPGMRVWIGDGRLTIPSQNCTLWLPEDAAWEPVPDVSSGQWHCETVTRHATMLAHYLSRVATDEGLASLVRPLLLGQSAEETPLARIALPALRLLECASREQDIAHVEEAASRLAGLGPGLTPSGDDALGGFIAILALLSQYMSDAAAPCDAIVAAIVRAARPGTGTISAALLAYAARGEVAEPVGALLLALASESPDPVMLAARHVLA
ncbi:MAG TPA: DUF2877 domain-containing protein, partial [Ktedonobacteraceae bacterium]|nr:DUF2877 domain-containing protein [Ktedonobacteraceae bacterium]